MPDTSPPAAGRPGPAKPPVFALWNPWASGWLTDAQHVIHAFGSAAAADEWQAGEENEVVELVPAASASRLASEAADAARAAIVAAIEKARDRIKKPCDLRDGLNHALSLARSAGAGEGREGGHP